MLLLQPLIPSQPVTMNIVTTCEQMRKSFRYSFDLLEIVADVFVKHKLTLSRDYDILIDKVVIKH